MGLNQLIKPFPWYRYSKKLSAKIDQPRCAGFFEREESEARGMRLVEAAVGTMSDGNFLCLYWLVDSDDGIIVDVRFQAFGHTALIGAAEIACELMVAKNYDQARRISADLIDRCVRDRPDEPAFPHEAFPLLNMVLEAIDLGSDQCMDIPIASGYLASPVGASLGDVVEGGLPGWGTLSIDQKIAAIEEVLDQDVRPYVALDAGGVHVLNLLNDSEVIIAYSGACTSCYSSIGTTLSYIQQILRNKIHPQIVVTPNLDFQVH
jgi:NifU-like protein